VSEDFLTLSATSVRAHIYALQAELREARRLGREVADIEEQIDEEVWLLTKLSVAQIAVAGAVTAGRNFG
jgi:hypothetical protein